MRCSTKLRAPRTTVVHAGAYVSLATLGVGALIAAAPALAVQLAIITGTAVSAMSVMLARAGRVLNSGWVIVAMLYLIGPVGGIFSRSDTDGSAVGVLLLGLTPFAVAALVVRPEARARLLLLMPVVLLVLLAFASLAWSPSRSYGSAKLLLWVLTGLLPAAFIVVLGTGSRRVAWGLIVAAAFATAVATYAFPDPTYPPTLFNANPIWASRAAFLGVLIALFGPFPTPVKLVTVPVMFAGGLIGLSFGPLVGLAAGIVAGIAVALRRSDQASRLVALSWASLGLAVGLVLMVVVAGAADPLLAQIVNDPNAEARAGYLRVLAPLFLNAPLIGVGIGGFAATGIADYPHNLVAEVAAELGFAGLVLLVTWLLVSLRAAAGSPVLTALVVAASVFSIFSGNVASNTEFWLFTALAVATSRIGRGQGSSDAVRSQ